MQQARPLLDLAPQIIRINTSIRPTNTVRILLSLQAMHMKLYLLSTTRAASARRTAAKVKPYDTKIIAPWRPARQILHPFLQVDSGCIIVSKCSAEVVCIERKSVLLYLYFHGTTRAVEARYIISSSEWYL
jgi:hypothetical protein